MGGAMTDEDTGNMITVLTIFDLESGGGEDVVPGTRFVLAETMHYKMGSHDPFFGTTLFICILPILLQGICRGWALLVLLHHLLIAIFSADHR